MASLASNIGPAGRRRRSVLGGVMLAAGVGAGLVLVLTGADRGLRLILFVPFWMAGLGLFQAREHT